MQLLHLHTHIQNVIFSQLGLSISDPTKLCKMFKNHFVSAADNHCAGEALVCESQPAKSNIKNTLTKFEQTNE